MRPATGHHLWTARIAYYELRLYGPKQDLHSGSFGGAVHNPAIALAKLISQMIDDGGRIQLPGFYDSVKPLAESERAMWRGLNFDEQKFANQLGVSGLTGEAGYTTLERRWARPTFDVHGLMVAIRAKAARRSFRAMPRPKSAFAWCRISLPAK